MIYKLSIQDVAAKQLESAIWMFAYDYDEVAVHTIAAAAFELLTERLKIINIKEYMKKSIKPEKHKEFIALWNKPYNFFKHGEHNYESLDELTYNEDSVQLLLYIASEANLIGIEEYRLKSARVFKLFFLMNNIEMVEPDVYEKFYKDAIKKLNYSPEQMKSKETLKLMLELGGHNLLNGLKSPYSKMPGELY